MLISEVRCEDGRIVCGYAVEDSELSRHVAVELIVDGLQIGVKLADEFCRELAAKQIGHGCYGFSFVLSDDLARSAICVEARLPNGGAALGPPLLLEDAETPRTSPSAGMVRWEGGLRLSGWVASETTETPIVQVCIDGEVIVEERAEGWRHAPAPVFAAMPAFDVTLPRRFADGRVWRVSVVLPDGRELDGSPVTLVAFDSGLASLVATLSDSPGQRLQGALFDQLVPQSMPFSLFSNWKAMHPAPPPKPSRIPTPVAIFDGEGVDGVETSLQAQTSSNWSAGVIPAEKNGFSFDAAALREYVREHVADARFCVFLLPGVELEPDALAHIASCFDEWSDLDVLYWDLSMVMEDGGIWPVAFPALDYMRLLEQGYFAAAFALSAAMVKSAVAKGVDNVFRLANIAFDAGPRQSGARHLPGFLARAPSRVFAGGQPFLESATREHLSTRGFKADVMTGDGVSWPACRVRFQTSRRSSVSIIIPTRDRVSLLRGCVASIQGAVKRAQAEIIVVDNDSSDPETLAYLQALSRDGVSVLRAPGPFNFSRLNNLAARSARGDILCFLNNDVVATDTEWLEQMLSLHVEESIGAVGALLAWPTAMVQHAGVVLGVNFETRHAFSDRLSLDPGYTELLRVAHECSAVTAACMTTRRETFLSAGGFDETAFPVNFNDVDYCLKLRQLGLRVVLTPHARLIHHESASRGRSARPESYPGFAREQRNLRSKWGAILMADPYYSPALSLDDPPYAALAWPPRNRAARTPDIEPARIVPAGL